MFVAEGGKPEIIQNNPKLKHMYKYNFIATINFVDKTISPPGPFSGCSGGSNWEK